MMYLNTSIHQFDSFSDIPLWSYFFFLTNYWESFNHAIHPALGPAWSLAIEEQFYLVGPIAFSLLSRRKLVILLSTLLIAVPILRIFLSNYTEIDTWRFTFTHIDPICAGLLLALITTSNKALAFIRRQSIAMKYYTWILAATIIYTKTLLATKLWDSIGLSLLILVFCGMILTLYINHESDNIRPATKSIFKKPLRWLGLRCYFIYLYHMLFKGLCFQNIQEPLIALLATALSTLLFAHISWKYLESHLIKIGKKFSY